MSAREREHGELPSPLCPRSVARPDEGFLFYAREIRLQKTSPSGISPGGIVSLLPEDSGCGEAQPQQAARPIRFA
jgi:hypothetical protein